jgi:hypothetical protein
MVDSARLPNLRDAASRISVVVTRLGEIGERLMAELAAALEPHEAFTKSDQDVLALAEPRFRQATGMGDDDVGSRRIGDLVFEAARAVVENDALSSALAQSMASLVDPDERAERLVSSLLQIEVVERVAAPAQPYRPAARFRFYRFGLNTPTDFLIRGQTPRQKLTGTRLHHFGAFFRRSWRAYDWTWGRLDGASHIVNAVATESALRRVLPSKSGADLDRFVAETMSDDSDPKTLREALGKLKTAFTQTEGPADVEKPLSEVRHALARQLHRRILQGEVPRICELESSLIDSEEPLTLMTDDGIRHAWTAICANVMTTSITSLTLTPEGREVVGTTIASGLRAVSLDDLSMPRLLRRSLLWAAFVVRLLTRRGAAGLLARVILTILTLSLLVLTVWPPFEGVTRLVVRLAAAALCGLLVPLTSIVLLGGARRWFRRSRPGMSLISPARRLFGRLRV